MCNTRKQFLFLVIFLCLELFSCEQDIFLSCGKRKAKTAYLIHKGSDAAAGNWPWHAAIYHQNDYKCGGSVIDANTVLTASHCVCTEHSVLPASHVSVHVGRDHLKEANNYTQIHRVKKIIVHPDFSGNSIIHDIALIKLRSNIMMNKFVQPVCLWTMDSKQELIVGKNGTIVGFGINERDVLSDQLKQALIAVVDPLTCIAMDRTVFGTHLTWETFCGIGQEGVNACNGDSGGGLFFEVRERWYVRGLVSYTSVRGNTDLCDPLKPTAYTDVAKYLDWIKPYIDQRVLQLESNVFDIDYEEKLRLFNFQTCGTVSLSKSIDSKGNLILPWLGFYTDSQYIFLRCAVTLISEWYAIGPAHCFETVEDNFFVILGGYEDEGNATCSDRDGVTQCYYPIQKRKIQNVIKHPEFDRNKQAHNIALIEFTNPADITQPNVKPICLPVTSLLRTNSTTNLYVAVTYKHQMNLVPVRYMEPEECITLLSPSNAMMQLETNQLCCSRKFMFASSGNEKPGLPLQGTKLINGEERYFLRGLDLFGLTSMRSLTIYLNAEPYVDWILYNMRYHTVETDSSNSSEISLESEWNMLQQQPGKEKLRLFDMDTCGVTPTVLQPEDHVPWIGTLGSQESLIVLITEWYALAPKYKAHAFRRASDYGRLRLILGKGYVNQKNVATYQEIDIKNAFIPPPDHPKQTLCLLELLEPADLKNPFIKPICLPFMERIHQLNSTQLVFTMQNYYYMRVYNRNVTKIDHQACQQRLMWTDSPVLKRNFTCAAQPDESSELYYQSMLFMHARVGTTFQMPVQFQDQQHYFLYGMITRQEDVNRNQLRNRLFLFDKIELADFEWILEYMQEKERQNSFLTSTGNERIHLEPVNVPRSKRHLFNFATCGASASTNRTPWLGTVVCRKKNDTVSSSTANYEVTLVSEWYAVGPAKVHGDCFKNGEEFSNIVIFGHPCFKTVETKGEEAQIIESCEFPTQRIAIKDIVVHPQFNETSLHNNIALIRLAAPANTSLPNVKPICLPIIDAIRSYETSNLTIATYEYENSKYDFLTTNVEDRYINPVECQKRWQHRNVVIDSSNHCVINKRTSNEECVRISHGAPLHSRQMLGSSERNFLRGFAFDEASKCSIYFPGIYTNTDAFLDWMLETMEPPPSQPFDLRKELFFSN